MNPFSPLHRKNLRPLLLTVICPLLAVAWAAQAKPSKSEVRDYKRDMILEKGAKKDKRDASPAAKAAPSAAQLRILDKLREALEVEDDAEWEVIGERIMKVSELRTTLWTGAAGSKAAPSLSAKSKSKGSAHPEQDALRAAVKDNLPDAEVKLRLARAHEVFVQNEARLAQAQAELRSVLSVRQEAVAVMAGLLPP